MEECCNRINKSKKKTLRKKILLFSFYIFALNSISTYSDACMECCARWRCEIRFSIVEIKMNITNSHEGD